MAGWARETRVVFSFDGEPDVRMVRCGDCGQQHEAVTGFVLCEGFAHAVYWADWYPHQNEAYVDLILGSWEEPEYEDHVTFGCRIGRVPGQDGPQCSLVPAAQQRDEAPVFGTKLTREAALAHPWLGEFWDCIDWLTLNDPVLHEHVYHME